MPIPADSRRVCTLFRSRESLLAALNLYWVRAFNAKGSSSVGLYIEMENDPQV